MTKRFILMARGNQPHIWHRAPQLPSFDYADVAIRYCERQTAALATMRNNYRYLRVSGRGNGGRHVTFEQGHQSYYILFYGETMHAVPRMCFQRPPELPRDLLEALPRSLVPAAGVTLGGVRFALPENEPPPEETTERWAEPPIGLLARRARTIHIR